jgi:hypothetical protein
MARVEHEPVTKVHLRDFSKGLTRGVRRVVSLSRAAVTIHECLLHARSCWPLDGYYIHILRRFSSGLKDKQDSAFAEWGRGRIGE